MRGIDPVEASVLEDACIVLTEEERNIAEEYPGEFDYDPVEQAAANRMKARGNVIEDDDESLAITARGRIALQCHYATRGTPSGRPTP